MQLKRRIRALEQRQRRRTAERIAAAERKLAAMLGVSVEELTAPLTDKHLDLTPEQAADKLAAMLGVPLEELMVTPAEPAEPTVQGAHDAARPTHTRP
jgi:plasmid maintenance system antidote protein VapI